MTWVTCRSPKAAAGACAPLVRKFSPFVPHSYPICRTRWERFRGPKIEDIDEDPERSVNSNRRAWAAHHSWTAPPPAHAGRRGPLQDMSLLGKELNGVSSLFPPNVFAKVRPCGRCGVTVPKNPPNNEMKGVVCSECKCLYHQSCENLHHPPRFPGWMCEGCRVAHGVR
jgi:hypothetical protein